MSWRSFILVSWLALLGLSIALAALAAQYDTLPGDVRIAEWAQGQPFPGESLSDAARAITTTEVVLAIGAAAVAGLWLLGRRWEAALLLVGLIVLPLLQGGLKEIVDRPRPGAPLVDLRAGFSSASFPAGHVMSPIFLYGFFLYLSLRSGLLNALRLVVGLWSAFVLIAAGPPNVWLGVHWPSDILGGWAWGLVLLLPLLYALERKERFPAHER
ncbi:MAG: phosphatase PAP2 family protein [Chloroflexi bacterium]|nr:phosphatase PAP2 family protein [Chloroflexota bacterium]